MNQRTVTLTILIVGAMLVVSFAVIASNNGSLAVWQQRVQEADDAKLDAMIQDLHGLLSAPGTERLRVSYSIDAIQYFPRRFGDSVPFEGFYGLPEKQQREWLEKQQHPRSQALTHVVTIEPNRWGYESIAMAGDIYPVDRHQYHYIDFNQQHIEVGQYLPVQRQDVLPFEYAWLRGSNRLALSGRTPAELLGVYDNLPLLALSDEKPSLQEQSSQFGDVIHRRLVDGDAQELFLEAELSANGQLLSARYYEEPEVVREVRYLEYETIPGLSRPIPREFEFIRYSRANINNVQEDVILGRYRYTLLSAETDF